MPGAKPGAPLLQDFDVADHLRDEQETAMYMAACREEAGDDAAFIASAVAACERARARWSSRGSQGVHALNTQHLTVAAEALSNAHALHARGLASNE